MKAKRVLSVLLAAMLLVSSFVLSASADVIATDNNSLTIYLLKTDDENVDNTLDTNVTVDGDEEKPTNIPVPGAEFKLEKLDSDGNVDVSFTARTGKTGEDGKVQFTSLAKGRYQVTNTVQAPGTAEAYQTFTVDLPNTSVDGQSLISDVVVYPKQIVTGAVRFTKTFNGSSTVPTGVEASFKLQKEVSTENDAGVTVTSWVDVEDSTFVINSTSGNIKEISGLAFGNYRIVETGVTDTNTPAMYASTIEKYATFSITAGGVASEDHDTNYDTGTVVAVSMDNTSSTTPTVNKKVSADGSNYGESASIDATDGKGTAYWKIEATLPQDISNYKSYVITDDIDTRLTLDTNSVAITDISGTNYSLDTDDGNIKVTLSNFTDLTAGTVTITFKTTYANQNTIDLNVGIAIPNDVEVEYQNASSTTTEKIDNDNDKPDGDSDEPDDDPTPEHDPYIYTGQLIVTKTDNAGDAILGTTTDLQATFALYDSTKSTVIKTVTTNEEGKFTINGLKDGTYYLLETKAPKDYELYGDYIEITIGNGVLDDDIVTNVNNVKVTRDVANIPSTDLPLTGGMGVALFAGLGAVLVAVGGVLLFKKNKKADAVA